MKNNALKIALAVLTLASISALDARDAQSSSSKSSSTESKSVSSHSRHAAGDRVSHKNSAARIRAQKERKNAGAKSKRKAPAATPELIEEEKVELPSRDGTDNLDDNGPALMPDSGDK